MIRRLCRLAHNCRCLSVLSRRNYHYWIDSSNIDPNASGFNSSNVPSERTKVLHEYGISPVFGSRIAVLQVGSNLDASVFYRNKTKICRVIEGALGVPLGTVELGTTQRLREYVHFEPFHSRERFVKGAAIAARSLCEVYFPVEWNVEEMVVFADELQRIINGGRSPELARLGVTYAEEPLPDPLAYMPIASETSTEALKEIDAKWTQRVADVSDDLKKPIQYAAVSKSDVADDIWESYREDEELEEEDRSFGE